MNGLTLDEEDLLAAAPIVEPLRIGRLGGHGGFGQDGSYISPRTLNRLPAIQAWQEHHRRLSGREIMQLPADEWPAHFPNVAQTKFLLREGVAGPVVDELTRIGLLEGLGAMIRYVVADLDDHFEDDISGTTLAHLSRGLFEAHALDELGHEAMWHAARDVAFAGQRPTVSRGEVLAGLGVNTARRLTRAEVQAEVARHQRFRQLDPELELLLVRMVRILLVEVSARETFRWARHVLSDRELVSGDGYAARIIEFIEQDEVPHVEYLRTALTEVRDRTLLGQGGTRIQGSVVIHDLLQAELDEALGARRRRSLLNTLDGIESAVSARPDRIDFLTAFHSLGTEQTRALRRGASARADRGLGGLGRFEVSTS
jgi:hypothetical protein